MRTNHLICFLQLPKISVSSTNFLIWTLGRKSTSPGDSQDGRTQLGNENTQFIDTLIHLQHLQTNHSLALHEFPAAQDKRTPLLDAVQPYNKRHAMHRGYTIIVKLTIYHSGQARIDNTLQPTNQPTNQRNAPTDGDSYNHLRMRGVIISARENVTQRAGFIQAE